MNTEPLSKKMRFEVFKRDLFQCQYCGRTPPIVILEADHIVPRVNDGPNEMDNLITSCFDCNRGKGKNELTVLPEKTAEKMIIAQEKEEQYLAFKKYKQKIQKRIDDEMNELSDIYTKSFPKYKFSDNFKYSSLQKFIEKLGFEEVKMSLHYSCSRIHDVHDIISYFCGVCWGKIRKLENKNNK